VQQILIFACELRLQFSPNHTPKRNVAYWHRSHDRDWRILPNFRRTTAGGERLFIRSVALIKLPMSSSSYIIYSNYLLIELQLPSQSLARIKVHALRQTLSSGTHSQENGPINIFGIFMGSFYAARLDDNLRLPQIPTPRMVMVVPHRHTASTSDELSCCRYSQAYLFLGPWKHSTEHTTSKRIEKRTSRTVSCR
jgi:hypothetical protein